MRHIAPDHVLDDMVFDDVATARIKSRNCLAIADNRDAVCHPVDFIELVRNQDRGNALRLEFQQQVEQLLAVIFLQARSRLIKDQQLHFFRKRLGDFDQLLFADPDIGDQRRRVFFQTDF